MGDTNGPVTTVGQAAEAGSVEESMLSEEEKKHIRERLVELGLM